MQLARLIMPDELVVGLSIAETAATAVLFAYAREGKESKLQTPHTVREAIPPGVIVGGKVQDKNALVGILKQLTHQLPVRARYVVLSIPGDAAYFKMFTFPETLNAAKIEDAMRFAATFQLPWKANESYIDWERIPGEQPIVLLGAMPQAVADVYVDACEQVKLKIVAVEVHAMSLGRAAVCQEGSACMFYLQSTESTAFGVVRNGALMFHRVVPHAHADEKVLADESRKISEYILSDNGTVVGSLDATHPEIREPYGTSPDIASDPGSWAYAVGAAIRGALPRKQDTIISFMSVGTEEAYRQQRTLAFAGFLSALIIGLSVFFAVAFGLSWWGATYVRTSLAVQASTLAKLPLPADAAVLEDRVNTFNIMTGLASGLMKNFPQWSMVIDEVLVRLVPGITVRELSLTATDGNFTLQGVGVDRASVNLLRKSFEASTLFTAVQLPLANLEVKKDIPFSLTFKLKDPQVLIKY